MKKLIENQKNQKIFLLCLISSWGILSIIYLEDIKVSFIVSLIVIQGAGKLLWQKNYLKKFFVVLMIILTFIKVMQKGFLLILYGLFLVILLYSVAFLGWKLFPNVLKTIKEDDAIILLVCLFSLLNIGGDFIFNNTTLYLLWISLVFYGFTGLLISQVITIFIVLSSKSLCHKRSWFTSPLVW